MILNFIFGYACGSQLIKETNTKQDVLKFVVVLILGSTTITLIGGALKLP